MNDEEKRNGGKPDFDPGPAWARFERATAGEPVPAFWKQAEDNHPHKDGAVEMKRTNAIGVGAAHSAPAASAGQTAAASGPQSAGGGRWRTERPAKRRLRRLSAGVAAAAVAVSLFATPLGDRTLAAMLDTFRIQHMVGVDISQTDMAAISSLLERGSPNGDQRFDLAQYGTLTQSGGGESRTVTWAEAETRMGGTLIRLDAPAAPVYQPATVLTFRLNVKAVNRLLLRLGSDTTLPAAADGKAITLSIPDGVSMEGSLAGKPARLLQFGKPALTVEGGIDAAVVREAILGLPVLPDSLRTKLAAIGDWQNTLPVPAREGVTESLRLSGHEALMTEGDARRFLLWLDGARMNLLSVETDDFKAPSDFRRAAEALVGP